MKSIIIGELIRKHRIDMGLNQSDLCEGICQQSSLSRIETGEECPNQGMLVALLQRMGISGTQYYAEMTQRDYEVQEWKEKIMNYSLRGETEKTIQLIHELEKRPELQDDNLFRQFLLRYKVAVGHQIGTETNPYTSQEALDTLFQAIQCTIPNFQTDFIEQYLLCFQEAKIIVDIAMVYESMGKRNQALDIDRQLFEYVKNHYREIEDFVPVIPRLTYQYSILLQAEKRYEEAFDIAEYGRHYSVRLGRSAFLSNLLAIQGICDLRLGREEGKGKLKQAYYFMQALRQIEKMQELYDWAQENFQIDLAEDEAEVGSN